MKTFTGALAALLLLVACGQDDDQAGPQEGGQMTDETAGQPAEGSADETVERPDGMTLRLATLEQLPDDWGANLPDGHTLVRVTLELENTGGEAIPLETTFMPMALLHGPNRQDADRGGGYMDDGHDWSSDNPRQLGAGETIEMFYTFEVPDDDLDELYVEATVDEHPPFIFTDAETLLE